MKNNRAKKILSFVLAASMVFAAMAPTMSFAARDAVVKNDVVTLSAGDVDTENLLNVEVKVNDKATVGEGTLVYTLTTEAEKFGEKSNEGEEFTLKTNNGKGQIELEELFTPEQKEKLTSNIKFTLKVVSYSDENVDEFKFTDEDDMDAIKRTITFKDYKKDEGVQINSADQPMVFEFSEANETIVFDAKANGLKLNEKVDLQIKAVLEEDDNKVEVLNKTMNFTGKTYQAVSELGEVVNEGKLYPNAKYTFTATYEGVEKEITAETDDFGRIVKVNGNKAVYEYDKDAKEDLLKTLVFEFDKKLTEKTRFEIEKYDDEKGYIIEDIQIRPLKRKDVNTAYQRDKDGNYIVEYGEKITGFENPLVKAEDIEDAKFTVDKDDLSKLDEKEAKNDTAINLGKTDEQNIVALVFTEENRINKEDATEDPEIAARTATLSSKKERTKEIFINVSDLVDQDLVKLVNPFANFELEVAVTGGNPSKAIEGAKVEILPAELDTLGVAQYGKAIATGTTKANGKVKFENIDLETIIKHSVMNRYRFKDGEYEGEDSIGHYETVLPFKVVVNADGFAEKGKVLTQENIVEEKVTIDLNTAAEAKDIRIAGANRYETALKVAKDLKEDGSKHVVLASGKNYADALVGARYANSKDAVLLLVENEMDKNVLEYLDMATEKVTILGGSSSVSPAVQEELAKKFTVNRIAGADRYKTAVKVAEDMDDVENLFVASGENYADALVASAAANRFGKSAVLLTEKANLNKDARAFIDKNAKSTKNVFVFGGEGSISGVAMSEINAMVTAERVKGADRDETAVAVAKKFFAEDAKAVVASGANYADALVAGTMNEPVLLVTGKVNDAVKTYLNDQIMKARVIGGTGSVSDAIVDEVVENLK